MQDPDASTLADWLALATEQLTLIQDRITEADVTADDMSTVGDYLTELAEHGHHLCTLALVAIDRAAAGHPIRGAGHGTELQAALGLGCDMFGAAVYFSTEVTMAADCLSGGGDATR